MIFGKIVLRQSSHSPKLGSFCCTRVDRLVGFGTFGRDPGPVSGRCYKAGSLFSPHVLICACLTCLRCGYVPVSG